MPGKLTIIKNARIMPLLGSMDGFTAGVFRDGELVADSLLHRAFPSRLYPVRSRLEGVYIFGGYLFGHFGHFLLESLSRLYAIKQCRPEYPILFLGPNSALHPAQSTMFKAMGVPNELILLKDPVEVESLIYGSPGAVLEPPAISCKQLAALGRFNIAPDTGKRKVWLSRSRFHGGKVVNEDEIEKIIAAWGWEIFHPELASLKEQVRTVNSASLVAGFDGSAFYLPLLAGKTHGRMVIFGRRNVIPEALRYFLRAKGVFFEEHVFSAEYLSGEGAASLFRLSDISCVTDVLAGAADCQPDSNVI